MLRRKERFSDPSSSTPARHCGLLRHQTHNSRELFQRPDILPAQPPCAQFLNSPAIVLQHGSFRWKPAYRAGHSAHLPDTATVTTPTTLTRSSIGLGSPTLSVSHSDYASSFNFVLYSYKPKSNQDASVPYFLNPTEFVRAPSPVSLGLQPAAN